MAVIEGTTGLNDWEICLIKGLLRNKKLSQQRIIAHFSYPERTVHHNVVSGIATRKIYRSDRDHPPADKLECEAYLTAYEGSGSNHRWALLRSSALNRPLRPGQLKFRYHYHPVGQGLFSSGVLINSDDREFRWVYDCGTEGGRTPKRQKHVLHEVRALTKAQQVAPGCRPRLDLVTLSHFDEDHLSGMLDLLSMFKVGTLLLPHLTPWQRLVVALREGAEAGSDLLAFLTAPSAFLLGRTEGGIERVLLVPPSGGGEALPPAVPPDTPPPDGEEPDRFPDVRMKDEAPQPEAEEALGADRGLANPRVRMLAVGGAITVFGAWEFVPYNDARLAGNASTGFKAKARPLAAKLRGSRSAKDRQSALGALRSLYDKTFKTPASRRISARRRNEISLFLYSGPIGRVALCDVEEYLPRHRADPIVVTRPSCWTGCSRFGQMFTGDGYLKTTRQWTEFRTFFGAHDRLHRAGIFQVMHHGSKYNWQPDLACRIQPLASIFCSNPGGRFGHPHRDVLADFSRFNPRQVDDFHGWALEGRFEFV